ncbi:hypothetical protein C8J56DRAFT_1048600 [Mycena floridula]|nr:hypothetical protein C8J56DRAFT_1048600 [Mycena floridula]
MQLALDSATTKCVNLADPTAACSETFPNKTTAGICGRCDLLLAAANANESPEIMEKKKGCVEHVEQMTGWPWAYQSNEQLSFNLLKQKDRDRQLAMVNRLKPKGETPQKPVETHVAVATGAPKLISIYMAALAPKTEAAKYLGTPNGWFPDNMLFFDLVQHLLDKWVATWDRESSCSLKLEHLQLRFHNNINFEAGSTLGTIWEFYDIHACIPVTFTAPTTYKLKPSFLYFEALILTETFISDTSADLPHFMNSNTVNNQPKREAELSSQQGTSTSLKRSCTVGSALPSEPLVTQFRSCGTTQVILRQADIIISANGIVDIKMPDLEEELPPPGDVCSLANERFDSGKTQNVYNATFLGKQHAAKRFHNIRGGKNSAVTINENQQEIINEVSRLTQAAWLYEQFKDLAEDKGVEIDETLRVADCIVAVKIIADQPSPASGVGLTKYNDAIADVLDNHDQATQNRNFAYVTWLLEELRPKGCKWWSGTNNHPVQHSKLGTTLNAFAHFAFLCTNKTVVLADLQTSPAKDHHGKAINVLLDIMTHTNKRVGLSIAYFDFDLYFWVETVESETLDQMESQFLLTNTSVLIVVTVFTSSL